MEQDPCDNTNLMNNLSQMSLSEKLQPNTSVNNTQNSGSTIHRDINGSLSSPEKTDRHAGKDVNANPPSESTGIAKFHFITFVSQGKFRNPAIQKKAVS